MWQVLSRGCGRWEISSEPRADRACADLRGRVAEAGRSLAAIQEALVQFRQQGAADSPQYHQILTDFQKLSQTITRATKALKALEQQQSRELQTARPTGRFNLAAIAPIKSALGPGGSARAVVRGLEVTNLQQFLAAVGIAVTVNGEYDPRTSKAVQQFQGRYGLRADGLVGAETRKLINEMLNGV